MSLYQVVSPLGRRAEQRKGHAQRPRTLDGVTMGELSNNKFDTDFTFDVIEKALLKRFPNIRFVPHTEFGDTYGSRETEVIECAAGEARAARMRCRDLRQRRVRELHRREFASEHCSRERRSSDGHDRDRSGLHAFGQGDRQAGRARACGRDLPGRDFHARARDDREEHRGRARRPDRAAAHVGRGAAETDARSAPPGRAGDRFHRDVRGRQRALP